MEGDRLLTFTPVSQPDPRVQRIGFELTDPYVEQCWGAVVGPSCTLLLRRLPELWRDAVPAEIQAEELSCSLGLGHGVGPHSRIDQALKRLDYFGLTRTDDARFDQIDVYSTVSPLRARQLDRAPVWTRTAHEWLFRAHLERFEGVDRHDQTPTARTDLQWLRNRGPAQIRAVGVERSEALGR